MNLESSLNEGDKIFLFSEFSYDFKTLPLQIVEGVDLIYTPSEYELYSLDNNDKPFRYVNPLLNIPACGIKKCCIRISSKIKNQDEIFWQIILAFRLIKPLFIGISGSFKYTENDKCSEPSLYWIFSRINSASLQNGIQKDEVYSAEDFKIVAKILKQIRVSIKHFKRLKLAIASFTQITSGQSISYSMLYHELFACLEALFGSPYSGYFLSKRAYGFLQDQNCIVGCDFKKWLEEEYKNGRNNVSHGNPDYWMVKNKVQLSISGKRYSDLLKLHEIARLCILGFLGLRYTQLKGYNDTFEQKTTFFNELRASSLFLKNQKMFEKHLYVKNK